MPQRLEKIRENLKLREISKQLVAEDLATENVKENPVQNLTILADGSKQDSEVSSTTSTVEEFNNFSHCLQFNTTNNKFYKKSLIVSKKVYFLD